MIIKILGTESLGVRGLSCVLELKNRKIIIGPGTGFYRILFRLRLGRGLEQKSLKN